MIVHLFPILFSFYLVLYRRLDIAKLYYFSIKVFLLWFMFECISTHFPTHLFEEVCNCFHGPASKFYMVKDISKHMGLFNVLERNFILDMGARKILQTSSKRSAIHFTFQVHCFIRFPNEYFDHCEGVFFHLRYIFYYLCLTACLPVISHLFP